MPKNKLAPLSVNGMPGAAATKPDVETTPPAIDAPAQSAAPTDAVDKWLADHPDDGRAPEPAQTETPPADKPADPAEPVTAPAEPKPGAAEPAKSATEAAPKGADPVAADPNAKPQTTVDTAKPTYAPEEKFALGEGAEWTRAQIVAGLTERHKLLEDAKAFEPVKAEAEGYKQLFGMPLADAQKAWGPILQRLVQEPNTSAFIDRYLQDDGLAEYLERCAAHYTQEVPPPQRRDPQAREPQRAPVDPEMARQVRELSEWRAREEKSRADERVRTEWAQATQRYPFLETDAALRDDFFLTAKALSAQDPNKGILDALALKASMYEALKAARAAQGAPAAPAAAQPQVPALLGSPGASPSASRTQTQRVNRNDPNYDPVENWIKNPPPQFAS